MTKYLKYLCLYLIHALSRVISCDNITVGINHCSNIFATTIFFILFVNRVIVKKNVSVYNHDLYCADIARLRVKFS